MSWSATAQGTKEVVKKAIAGIKQYPEGGDQSQVEACKVLALAELEAQPEKDAEGNPIVYKFEGSGHTDGTPNGARNFKLLLERLWVMWK